MFFKRCVAHDIFLVGICIILQQHFDCFQVVYLRCHVKGAIAGRIRRIGIETVEDQRPCRSYPPRHNCYVKQVIAVQIDLVYISAFFAQGGDSFSRVELHCCHQWSPPAIIFRMKTRPRKTQDAGIAFAIQSCGQMQCCSSLRICRIYL